MLQAEDEDDVTVFDKTSLITRSSKRPGPAVSLRNNKLINTLSLCGAFFGIGLAIAIPGPTLGYLQCRVGATLQSISYIFPSRSVGYLVGSVVGGILFDRFPNKEKLFVALALILAGITICIAPWVFSLPTLCVLFSLTSIAMGFLDTGGNVICLKIWGKSSGPYMQSLHFAFGLGACIAPLVAAPFLSSVSGLTCNTSVELGDNFTLTTPAASVPQVLSKRAANDSLSGLSSPFTPSTQFASGVSQTSAAPDTRKSLNTSTSVTSAAPAPGKPSHTGEVVSKNADLNDGSGNNIGKYIDDNKQKLFSSSLPPTTPPTTPPLTPLTTPPTTPPATPPTTRAATSFENSSTNSKEAQLKQLSSDTTENVTPAATSATTPSAADTGVSSANNLTGFSSPPSSTSAVDTNTVAIESNNTSTTNTSTTNTSTTKTNSTDGATTSSADTVTTSGTDAVTTSSGDTASSYTSDAGIDNSTVVTSPKETFDETSFTNSSYLSNKTTSTTPLSSSQSDSNPSSATPASGSTASSSELRLSTTTLSTTTITSSTSATVSNVSTIAIVSTTETTTPTSGKMTPTPEKTTPTAESEKTIPAPEMTTPAPEKTTPTSEKTTSTPEKTTPTPEKSKATTRAAKPSHSGDSNAKPPQTFSSGNSTHTPSFFEQAKDVFSSISKVQFSYLIIAIVLVTFGVVFCCLQCGCCSGRTGMARFKSENDLQEVVDNFTASNVSTHYKVKVMSAAFVFFFVYVGTEVAYGQFIATFGILHRSHLSEKRAALLTSLYWGSFAMARGLCIPLSKCLTPNTMLIVSIVISVFSTAGLAIATTAFAALNGPVWFFSLTLGVGMAAIFPTGVLWLENYIKVTSKMAAVFVCASALGEMAVPAIVGFSINSIGPLSLIYTSLISMVICAATFIVMKYLVSAPRSSYRPVRTSAPKENRNIMQMQEFEFSDDSDLTDSEPILRKNVTKLNGYP